MDISDWISVFMALVTLSSAVTTYLVYRSTTDPEVVVYTEVDKKRPSILNLVITNIGKGPALDITFKFNRPLPARAFGITAPNDLPTTMDSGPILKGVPYLAPNKEIIITWGQYGGLKSFIQDNPIQIEATYYRSQKDSCFSKPLFSISKLDVSQFETSDASDQNWDKQLVETLARTNSELAKIHQAINKKA